METIRAQSRDAATVERLWQRFVPSARLERADPRDFSFEWASTDLDGLSVVGYELAAGVQSAIEPHEQLMACRVDARSGWVGTSKVELDPNLPWVSSGEPIHAGWEGRGVVRAFVFDLPAAERVARLISGDDRLVLRVTDATPRTLALAHLWEQTHRYVTATLTNVEGMADLDRGLEDEMRRHALRVTLSVFPTTFLAALEKTAQTRAAPATVRRAIAFIEGNLAASVSVDDVAVAAGISTRGLQYAFHRAVGVSPAQYIRRARLAEVRRELRLTADANVAEVARRWGFTNVSRFATYYRAAYGTDPGGWSGPRDG